jgi:hypothetical protein
LVFGHHGMEPGQHLQFSTDELVCVCVCGVGSLGHQWQMAVSPCRVSVPDFLCTWPTGIRVRVARLAAAGR